MLEIIEKNIGYSFVNSQLLELALFIRAIIIN
jgi:dsRNA-specific ribonuclease